MTDNKIFNYDNSDFIKALAAILLGSVLVNLWIRVINNFTYQFLNLNQESTFWALMIAIFFTGLLILYLTIFLDDDTSCQIKQSMTGVAFAGSVTAINNGPVNDFNDFNE